ncbi:hypothetical protein [Metabacillus bambusae]|uniref:Phospholipid phosphatase n=1 Tax=Metabacillus bambusae TaxID=2795218 RepID=A0ABS3N2V5_9BACI|nr:hypothetical protein [Metabacillus bambusae]MBO1512626.1 hypothetical protein [Metabacillus bambusae]
MDTVIYLLLTIAYIVLFILGILLAKYHSWINIGNVLLIVILALFYDNGILAFGKYWGEGDLLRALNQTRYWLHALFTPLLVLFAWHTLVNANLQWAKKRIVQWLVIILTLCLIIIELVTVVWGISLEPIWKYGVLSYKNVGNGSPFMIIGVSIMLLITSIIIWWKQKWPWYFVGTLFLGITPMIHLFLKTDALHNISEFLLMLALLATNAFQGRKM